MTDYLIDTNCLLSYSTERSPEQQEAVSGYILRASQLELTLTVTPHVLGELVYVMLRVYDEPDTKVADLVASTLDTPGIRCLDTHPVHELLAIWPTDVADYGNAAIAATARAAGLAVLTLDRAFTRSLKRLDIACQMP